MSGPCRAGEVCAAVTAATGLAAAVVDANDLGFVDVSVHRRGVRAVRGRALRANPAGNAEETTPLVLIRPGDGVRGRPPRQVHRRSAQGRRRWRAGGDDMTGRVAVVSGGGRGIGRAIAEALGAQGRRVAVCDILESEAAEPWG